MTSSLKYINVFATFKTWLYYCLQDIPSSVFEGQLRYTVWFTNNFYSTSRHQQTPTDVIQRNLLSRMSDFLVSFPYGPEPQCLKQCIRES